jgi:hypothetical protein
MKNTGPAQSSNVGRMPDQVIQPDSQPDDVPHRQSACRQALRQILVEDLAPAVIVPGIPPPPRKEAE